MKTRISAVTVAVLALFGAAACDDSSSTSLDSRTPDRLPQRGATDESPPSDPDNNVPGGSTDPGSPSAGGPGGGGTTAPGTGAGAGTGGGGGATPPVAGGQTAVLNTFSKVWVSGDTKGPNKIGQNTGAGTMDSFFAWNEVAFATDKSKVELMTIYTRSDNQVNNNSNNSYMQGGVAFATLTAKGVVPGAEVDLPRLNGDRTFMRPVGGYLSNNRALLIAASEDNGVNNNPQPVAYLVNTQTGARIAIPNSNRQNNGQVQLEKPANLIRLATDQGINVNNPQNQRGPHTAALDPSKPDTILVGMQYNNQAQEAFSVTVNADNSIKMNWVQRYSNTAQHCRPQIIPQPGSTVAYVAAVEANNQPAEIGFRVTKISTVDGKAAASKIVVRSDPGKNKYVSEPVIGLLNPDKLAITYGLSAKARENNNGNGHAGGAKVDAAVLVATADLSIVGAPALGVGQYGRHGSSFITNYGPDAQPSLAVISGSSTGTGPGFIQMYPLKADGLLGVKDPAKVYSVAQYSDVANVQARGKRNPNNQARGFINGLGNVPNPGYTANPGEAAVNFMPDVKQFSFSTVTGYSGPEAMGKGLKNSIWLSLVPAAWTPGLQTIPGKATDKPGVNADGTGPAPRSTGPATNPNGDVASGDVVPDGDGTSTRSRSSAGSDSGCSTAPGSSSSGFGLVGLAIAGLVIAARRKREEA